jgi:hypothetical protein
VATVQHEDLLHNLYRESGKSRIHRLIAIMGIQFMKAVLSFKYGFRVDEKRQKEGWNFQQNVNQFPDLLIINRFLFSKMQ